MADVKKNVSNTSAATAPKQGGSTMLINVGIVVACAVVAHLIFYLVFGSKSNFHDETMHTAKNLMGTVSLKKYNIICLPKTSMVLLLSAISNRVV